MKHVLICIPLVLALGVTPGLAQSGSKDGAVSACTAVEPGKAAEAQASCKAAIAAYIAALKAEGKTQAAINALLGALVYSLATSPALATNPLVQTLVADAIAEVADKIPDPVQKAAIQSVATEIRTTGTVQPGTLTSAQSASTR